MRPCCWPGSPARGIAGRSRQTWRPPRNPEPSSQRTTCALSRLSGAGVSLTRAGSVGGAVGVSEPMGAVGAAVVGTGVVGTGVVGTGVVGTGVVGTGVVGTGVVGTGVVGTGVVGAGVVGVGDVDWDGWTVLDTCGVAAARAASALPPSAPAMCVAATGLCLGSRLGGALWLDTGGATDGVWDAT